MFIWTDRNLGLIMVLYKTIADQNGGKQVEMTAEEEKACRDEWAVNDELKILKIAERERIESIKIRAREKLYTLLGLTDEEKELLF